MMAEQVLLQERTRSIGELDQRRPGRIEYTNPHLIALLRQTASETPPPEPRVTAESDGLEPSRGVLVGSVAGAVIWGGVALLLKAFGVL